MNWKISAAVLVTITASALACCMVPLSYEGSIGQDAQEAVLIYDEGREDLVLRINYRITGESMPDTFAWVITVPAEPDKYALADEKLFKEMFELARRFVVPAPRSMPTLSCSAFKMGGRISAGLEFGERVNVGPYDIQPVRGVGANALQALNGWLHENGFPTEDESAMRYFVEEGFTFLCVKITAGEEGGAVSPNGLLPPLHLSFKSDGLYYPLRFSSRQGVFDVNLHVLTQKKLDYEKGASTLERIAWGSTNYKRNVKLNKRDFPDALKAVFAKGKRSQRSWRYNNIRCYRVNRDNSIKTWPEDVFLALR